MNGIPILSGTAAAGQLNFEPVNFLHNLKYMATGMLAIFAIIGVIILVTMLINYLFSE